MNKFIVIANQGEILPEALYVLGAGTKRGTGLIGYWCTGNKYAMAKVLRDHIPVRVFSGLNEITVETKKLNFREKEFDQVYINGKSTGNTTDIGPDWKPWYIIREFLSNALDEGGASIYTTNTIPNMEAGKTFIILGNTVELNDIIDNISDYFLLNHTSYVWEDKEKGMGIIRKSFASNPTKIYRRGVLVFTDNDTLQSLPYNFYSEHIHINENREAQTYTSYCMIGDIMAACNDQDIILDYLEWLSINGVKRDLVNDSHYLPITNAWRAVLKDIIFIPKELSGYFNYTTGMIMPMGVIQSLKSHFGEFVNIPEDYNVINEGLICDIGKDFLTVFEKAIDAIHDCGFKFPSLYHVKQILTEDPYLKPCINRNNQMLIPTTYFKEAIEKNNQISLNAAILKCIIDVEVFDTFGKVSRDGNDMYTSLILLNYKLEKR